MSDHGILMKGEMIRAYLNSSKWMTRRTRGLDDINKNPDNWKFMRFVETIKRKKTIEDIHQYAEFQPTMGGIVHIRLPYGWIGDLLWFKETYAVLCQLADPFCPCETEEERTANHTVEYRANTGHLYPGDWPEEEARGNDEAPKWKSSMYMPRKYSRISVPVVNVRVERVRDIGTDDILAEGVNSVSFAKGVLSSRPSDPRWKFIELWDSINAKRGMGWDVNPWVWVYEFPKFSKLETPSICSLGFAMNN